MLFNSPVFLFVFLPIVLLALLLKRVTLQNYFLVFFSLLFYAWGGVSYSIILILSVTLNYFAGIIIGKQPTDRRKLVALQVSVAINLLMLAYFKFANFLVDNLNIILNNEGYSEVENQKINLPIGISFYTFHAISYVVDVHRGKSEPQKNILNLGLYFMFFPQLIAGPIVRYHNISRQLLDRNISQNRLFEGIKRFIKGLAKKVIIANSFAVIVDEIFLKKLDTVDIYMAWLGAIGYTIQIYFDFSGYSDMAIGLALMFGFTFPENFNLPYISTSIKEFWQRWHISLSIWFKDYLYIPLGGSKNGEYNTYKNLLIVFICTGFWHGASFNFLIWGLFHGLFIILERLEIIDTIFPNKILKHLYTLLVVIIAWVFFRAETLPQATQFITTMFGGSKVDSNVFATLYYFNLEMFVLFILAIILMFGIHKKATFYFQRKISIRVQKNFLVQLIQYVILLGLFAVCIIYIGASTNNSFIYFRF